MTTLLQACLNGHRTRRDHPAVPLGADELARDAAAAVAAGAGAIHAHPRDGGGRPTMGPHQCAAAVAALRAAVPGTPIGLTTHAESERDPERRVALVRRWKEPPDFASVNWSEDGAEDLAAALLDRGAAVEAGIWTADDARRFAASAYPGRCLRALVEPLEPRVADALASAARIVELLRPTGLPLVVHGHEGTTWAVLRWSIAHGHGVRIGLEDTLTLEGGRPARDNAELVAAAARLRRA